MHPIIEPSVVRRPMQPGGRTLACLPAGAPHTNNWRPGRTRVLAVSDGGVADTLPRRVGATRGRQKPTPGP
eukprot:3398820-Lingulodinium_polyedra.AAC.1